MSGVIIILLSLFVLLICLGTPIAFSIGTASIAALIDKGGLSLIAIPQRMFNSLDSFTLLAIPFFIYVGDIMMKGGISSRLINLAKAFLGWMRGCMAYCTVVASAFFGAISGSAPATCAAIGGMMYPEMLKMKYPPAFAAYLGAISGTLGVLIPPSIPFVIFGTSTGTSVGNLFKVGGVAGAIICIAYCVAAKITIRNEEEIVFVKKPPTLKDVWMAFKDAFWGILSPVIILGGIYSGKFTATEAAVVAVIYSLIVGLFIYKELTVKTALEAIVGSMLTSGMVLLLVSFASLFSYVLTVESVATLLKTWVTNIGATKILFLAIINIIYLVLGMIMDTIPIIILTAPIFSPIATMLGISPVQLGVVTVVNLAYGMITPPFGINLFVASGYSKCRLPEMIAKGKWFYLIGALLLLVVTYCPFLYLWIVE